MSTPCPVCGALPMRQIAALHGFPLMVCPDCDHHCLSTEGADLASFYGDHYTGFRADPVQNARIREVLTTSIAPLLPPRARVLDVGCGNGEFLVAARERGHDVFGLDFSQAAADACQKRGVPAAAGNLLSHDFGARAPFDLVTMWDVLEHLPRPLDFLQRARSLLAPGGWLVLKVPCFARRGRWLAAHVPRTAGALLGSPSHVQFFHPAGLTRLLRRAGFESIYAERLAPMHGPHRTMNPLKLAKHRLIRDLCRFAGNRNLLVRAQATAS